MSQRMRERLRRAAGAVCLLAALLLTWLAGSCFRTAWEAPDLWPYLISETAEGGASAMYTLEEVRFKWMLGGGLFALPALPLWIAGLRPFARRRVER